MSNFWPKMAPPKPKSPVVRVTGTSAGNVTGFKAINSVSRGIDNAIALKKTDGKWLPGYNNEKPLDMTKEVSMVFCLKKRIRSR